MPNEGFVLDNPVLRIDGASRPLEDEQEPRGSHDEHIPWGYGARSHHGHGRRSESSLPLLGAHRPRPSTRRDKAGTGAQDAWVNLQASTTSPVGSSTAPTRTAIRHQGRSHRSAMVHARRQARLPRTLRKSVSKSLEGYFVKIARSGRRSFPASSLRLDGTVEWLTVRTTTGPVERPGPAVPST